MTGPLRGTEVALGESFGEHLRLRSSSAAQTLAARLMDSGDSRRAEHLDGFAANGPHTQPATWWGVGATCHVGLELPAHPQSGDLWFDPLEANWSVVVPWVRPLLEPDREVPPFIFWVAIEAARSWQLLGAHHIAPDVPESLVVANADSAWRYCSLFGKQLADWGTWRGVGRAYEQGEIMRLWGDSPGEIGLGGTESDSALMIRHADILRVKDQDAPDPEQTGDRNQVGLAFRTDIDVQLGLARDDEALDRVWHG